VGSRISLEMLLKRHTAHLLRTVLETLLLSGGLTAAVVVLYESQFSSLYSLSLLFFINPLCAMWYAVRVRPPQGGWLRQVMVEAGCILLMVLVLRLSPVVLSLYSSVTPLYGSTIWFEILLFGLLAFPFFFFRLGSRVLTWWGRIRQKRLLWSLVHGHLLAMAALQAILSVPLLLLLSGNYSNLYDQPLSNPFGALLLRIQVVLPFVGILILGATSFCYRVVFLRPAYSAATGRAASCGSCCPRWQLQHPCTRDR
jgi:hypothetical protein